MNTTKALQREQTQKRVKRYRDRQKALQGTEPFVTPDLPPERIERIEAILARRAVLGCPDDTKDRWRRALDYRGWELI
ncbi:MAG: hypothetical protein H8E40_10605 [Chloroflexi bacterium]|nr:hypothetical protein [Chloroflexota bacterium]